MRDNVMCLQRLVDELIDLPETDPPDCVMRPFVIRAAHAVLFRQVSSNNTDMLTGQ